MTEISPVSEGEDRSRTPWIIGFLWKIVRLLLVLAALIWITGSLLLNFYAKDSLEKYLSDHLGRKVTISDVHLGLDPVRPTIVIAGLALSDNAKAQGVYIGKLEAGVYLKGMSFDKEKPQITYYAGVGGLTLGGKDYGAYEAPITVSPDGTIAVKEFKGSLGEAKMLGSLVESPRHAWHVDMTAEGVDYSLFAAGVKGGDAHLTLRMTASDAPPEALVQSLNGRATLVGGDGRLEGNTLNLWAGSLLTAFLPGQDKDTHLNCAVADFDVKNGVAHSRTIIIDTDKATITGKGTVDLVHQRVDMRFSPQTKGVASVSLATPVIVSGPFANITTHPDPTGVAEKMGGLILGAVASPVALLSFLHAGGGNPCQKFLEQAKTP